jgi:predicted CoA-binding protein
MNAAEEILRRCRTVAVVGASDDTDRPSGFVPKYLKEHGYRMIPVNPGQPEILGEKAYPDLSSIPEPVDLVNIFKRSKEVGPYVDEAIRIGAKAVWMQQGIRDDDAARRATDAGLLVVMDRCMRTEHRRLPEGEEATP